MKVWLTELAELDLKAIADRIVERNPSRALSFVVELRDCCARIGELPHAGLAGHNGATACASPFTASIWWSIGCMRIWFRC